MPVENLLSPQALRNVSWSPPEPLSTETISVALLNQGSRPWQIKETAALIALAFINSEEKLLEIQDSENLRESRLE